MKKTPKLSAKQLVFESYRKKGYNQKQSAFFAGVSEKTAVAYEKVRKEKKERKLNQVDDLIFRLKTRADKPETSVQELIDITYKLEDLVIKRENLVDQF